MEVPNFISLIKIAKHNATGVFFIIDWYAIYDVFYSKPIFDKKKYLQQIYNLLFGRKSRIDNTSNQGKTPKRSAVGRLDFSHVTFRYPQKPDETVLNIKQLTIYSGQFVGTYLETL